MPMALRLKISPCGRILNKVTANRGELLNNVTANLRARGGRIAEANIQGTFVNGKLVTASIVPLARADR